MRVLTATCPLLDNWLTNLSEIKPSRERQLWIVVNIHKSNTFETPLVLISWEFTPEGWAFKRALEFLLTESHETTMARFISLDKNHLNSFQPQKNLKNSCERTCTCIRELGTLLHPFAVKKQWRPNYYPSCWSLSLKFGLNVSKMFFVFSDKLKRTHQHTVKCQFDKIDGAKMADLNWLIVLRSSCGGLTLNQESPNWRPNAWSAAVRVPLRSLRELLFFQVISIVCLSSPGDVNKAYSNSRFVKEHLRRNLEQGHRLGRATHC